MHLVVGQELGRADWKNSQPEELHPLHQVLVPELELAHFQLAQWQKAFQQPHLVLGRALGLKRLVDFRLELPMEAFRQAG